jgi:hypothetical protein
MSTRVHIAMTSAPRSQIRACLRPNSLENGSPRRVVRRRRGDFRRGRRLSQRRDRSDGEYPPNSPHKPRLFWRDADRTKTGALSGWGAWIRTREWRNQNPLPYHLATPQRCQEGFGRPGGRSRPARFGAADPSHVGVRNQLFRAVG